MRGRQCDPVRRERRPRIGWPGASHGDLSAPTGIVVNSVGMVDVVDTGNSRVETWAPESGEPRSRKTVYYGAEANPSVPECGDHAEWAGLVCKTAPAAEPKTNGVPELPETTFTYEEWGNVETAIERFGATVRTKHQTYDNAGRALTSEVTATADKATPVALTVYNKHTGSVERQETNSEGHIAAVTSVYNVFGQLSSYTDAAGATTTYKYDVDGRPEEVNFGTVDGETATQTYGYGPISGLLVTLDDSQVGEMSAGYGAEGNLTSTKYPDGVEARYTPNALGEPPRWNTRLPHGRFSRTPRPTRSTGNPSVR